MAGKPLPTQQELVSPNFDTATPPFDRSGKIAIDARKVDGFGNRVHFSQDGYRERFTNGDDQEVSFVLNVPWGYLAATRQWFLGYSYVDPVANADGSYTLHREIPFQVPKQGYEHLYCSAFDVVSAEGYVCLDPYVFVRDKDGQIVNTGNLDANGRPIPTPAFFPAWADRSTASDGNAKCRVTCRPRPFLCRADSQNLALQEGELNRYVSRGITPAIQSLSLPLGSIVWGADAGKKAGQSIPVNGQFLLVYTAQVEMVWHQVPSPPWSALRSALGKVNSNDFDFGSILGSPWGAGKLLCAAPPRWRPYRQSTGLFAWDLHYAFLYRDSGWNFYPDGDGNYFTIQYKDSGKPIFANFDYGALFKSGPPVQWD